MRGAGKALYQPGSKGVKPFGRMREKKSSLTLFWQLRTRRESDVGGGEAMEGKGKGNPGQAKPVANPTAPALDVTSGGELPLPGGKPKPRLPRGCLPAFFLQTGPGLLP